jgi:hypothetical protein
VCDPKQSLAVTTSKVCRANHAFSILYKQLRGTQKGKVCPKVRSKAKIVRKSSMHYRLVYAFIYKSGSDFGELDYYSGM